MINSTNESSQISSKFWKPRATPKEEPSLLPITWQLSHKPFKPIPTRYRVDIIALAVSPISGISIGSRLMPVHPLSPVERPFLRALYAPARTHARTHACTHARERASEPHTRNQLLIGYTGLESSVRVYVHLISPMARIDARTFAHACTRAGEVAQVSARIQGRKRRGAGIMGR